MTATVKMTVKRLEDLISVTVSQSHSDRSPALGLNDISGTVDYVIVAVDLYIMGKTVMFSHGLECLFIIIIVLLINIFISVISLIDKPLEVVRGVDDIWIVLGSAARHEGGSLDAVVPSVTACTALVDCNCVLMFCCF